VAALSRSVSGPASLTYLGGSYWKNRYRGIHSKLFNASEQDYQWRLSRALSADQPLLHISVVPIGKIAIAEFLPSVSTLQGRIFSGGSLELCPRTSRSYIFRWLVWEKSLSWKLRRNHSGIFTVVKILVLYYYNYCCYYYYLFILYFPARSVAHNIKRRKAWWIRKDGEGNNRGLNRDITTAFTRSDWRIPQKVGLAISGLWAEFWNRDHPNRKQCTGHSTAKFGFLANNIIM
jgi:hypothetical protein